MKLAMTQPPLNKERILRQFSPCLRLGTGNLKPPLPATVITFFPKVTISGPSMHNYLIVFQTSSRNCSNLNSDHCIRALIIATLGKEKTTKDEIKIVASYTGMVILYSCRTWSSVRVQSWESLNDSQRHSSIQNAAMHYSSPANYQGATKTQF